MDPRHRVLPVPSGFNDSFATFKHAIVGNNYTIAYSVGQLDIGSENKERLIIKTVQCIVHEAKTRKLTEEDVKSSLFHTWIDGITIELIAIGEDNSIERDSRNKSSQKLPQDTCNY